VDRVKNRKALCFLELTILVYVVVLLFPRHGWCQPVRIDSGLIQGVPDGAITVYKSIPFAAPPINELRWKSPRPAIGWSGVRRADKFGPICMQSGVSVPGAPAEPVSEDCLTLNIWTPAKSRGGKLPVMVFIPGGGFTQESGSMPLYWGDALARRGVIIVTVNYRVGIFGFFAHPELTRESGYHSSGNYGLLDLIAALEWIRKNITVFGGDPHSVTIWGQSAGSMMVSMLMASPLASGLFQRAIGHSGGFFAPPEATGDPAGWYLNGAEEQGLKYAASMGAPSMEALRKLAPELILKSSRTAATHPIIDKYVLPEEPYHVFSKRRQNDVPLLVGLNADEAKPLLAGRKVSLAKFSEDIAKTFRTDSLSDVVSAYMKIYPAANDAEAIETRAAFERDLRFGWEVWTWARMQTEGGKSRVFYYYFLHSPPFPAGSPFSGWGAGHWQELRYVFEHLDYEPWAWSEADRVLSSTMARYWTNFARNGDPNAKGLSIWPRFTKESGRVMRFDTEIAADGVPNLEGLLHFDGLYATLRRVSQVK
jgi:para-nitrobenzyl esterase